jgi:hypothetical protein
VFTVLFIAESGYEKLDALIPASIIEKLTGLNHKV